MPSLRKFCRSCEPWGLSTSMASSNEPLRGARGPVRRASAAERKGQRTLSFSGGRWVGLGASLAVEAASSAAEPRGSAQATAAGGNGGSADSSGAATGGPSQQAADPQDSPSSPIGLSPLPVRSPRTERSGKGEGCLKFGIIGALLERVLLLWLAARQLHIRCPCLFCSQAEQDSACC